MNKCCNNRNIQQVILRRPYIAPSLLQAVEEQLINTLPAEGGDVERGTGCSTDRGGRGDREKIKCLETYIKHLFREQNCVNKTNSIFIFQKKDF